jgi:Mrp family chromosome partitioning ATPase
MKRAAGIFASQWFHRRFTLAADGQYTTVTEIADWARAPYDDLRKSLLLGGNGNGHNGHANGQGNGHGNGGNGDAKLARVLLLAPARHGDGTTTTSVMLAASLATTSRCLLLELNFRRPGLAAALGATEFTALGDLLHEGEGARADLERAVIPTPVANLFALPNQMNGVVRGLPEVHAIGEIVSRLRSRFDHIVIDAAPVMGYPDTALLATVADGVLLVVAADATPLETALAARREIERAGACLLGSVVTRQRKYVPEFLARRLGET